MLSQRLTNLLRGSGPGTLERLADAIKHLLLDLELPDVRPALESLAEELPPLDPQAFLHRMSARMEQTVLAMAQAINAAPGGAIVAASEPAIGELLGELWADAVTLGVQMRVDAAAGDPPVSRWASKYRAMRAAGEALPDVSFRPKQ